VASLLLMSCETPQVDEPEVIQPNLDPRICAEMRERPQLPADASLPQPVTEAEQQGMTAFLTWLGDLVSFADEQTAVLDVAREGC